MLSTTSSKGQCAFEGDELIADFDTTSIPIIISGAVNDDLSSNNCLKAVTVHFKHQVIGELIIELVSPSGQKVTLVGPTATISAYTGDVTWNVQFFANSEQVFPDPFTEPVWNNLQTWLNFYTYVGSYYPHMGKLEDFNTGSVNGAWTFNFIDNVQFGGGNVFCLNLAFCEEEGISEETCSLVGHTLNENNFSACEGEPSLDFSFEPELDDDYDPTVYDYTYLVFEDDKFISLVPDQDLSSFGEGEYTLCGILYFIDDLPALNSIPIDETKEGIVTYIDDIGLCASLSDDCVEITIDPIPELVTEERSICQGDTVIINGMIFTESGQYNIISDLEPCDSVSILDLTVHSIDVIIESQLDTLSCDNSTAILDGSITTMSSEAEVLWTSDNGNFISKVDSAIVQIDRPGTYLFEVLIDGCVFSENITIGETEDYVYVDVSSNTLSCTLDSTFIDLSVSDTIESISWDGPAAFSVLNEDIRVGSGGVYTVNFVTNLGCEITREIEIFDDRIFPNLTIDGDTLTCTQMVILLTTSPNDTLGSTFQWYFEEVELSNDTFLLVIEPGLYTLEVTTELGCKEIHEYEVISEVVVIEVELITDTIDCSNAIVEIAYTSDLTDLDILWQLPAGEFVIDSSFNTSQVGTHDLFLNDANGCTLDTFLVVEMDSLLPEVSIFDASFFCGDDSIQLSAQTNFDDLSYRWTRPDAIVDTNMSPFIFSPGIYVLEVCRPNGCCAIDSVSVGVDNTVPLLSFDFQNLNCDHDTVYIIPSDTSSFLMEWTLNDLSFVADSNIIEVTEIGYYEVLVTDELNGCKSKYSFDITSDFYNEIESLFAEPLNCANEQVQIVVTAARTFESFTWTGPSVLDGNLNPFVNIPGEYIIDYTFTTGCTGSDTIIIVEEGEFPNLLGENETISCNDESVILNVDYSSSSISLSWTGPNFVGTGVSVEVTEPGTYTVVGIASGSCKDTIDIELFGDTIPPIVSIVEDGEITCVDSIVLITATIDFDTEFYEIFGPEIQDSSDLIFEVETPGIYTIQSIGFNGCLATASLEVRQSTDFPDYTIDLDSLTCEENNVTVGFNSTDPNLSVSWDAPIAIIDDAYSFNTNQAGNYVFSIVNSNGCFLKDSFFVVLDTFSPNNSIVLSSHINCLTDSATLSISNYNGEQDVAWNGPGVIDPAAVEFTTSDVGEYTLTLTSNNGCVTTDIISLEYDTLSPDITIVGDPINCTAGKTFLRVESDLALATFDWTGPNAFESTNAEPLVFDQGVYFVTAVAVNGCISSDTILIEDERVFPEIEVDDFYLPCDGAPAEVFVTFMSEGSFVRWIGLDYSSIEDTALIFVPGEYLGIAFNEEGCTFIDTFQVLIDAILPEFSGTSELLLCLGPIAMNAMDIEDDRSLYWNGPNDYFSEENPAFTDEPGIYQLVVTGDNGCIDSMAVEVVDGRIYPEAVANLDGPFQCENLEVFLSGEGSAQGNNYSINWTTEDGNIIQGEKTLNPKINKIGTYIIEITDNSIGCIGYDTLIVELEEQDLKGAEIEVTEPTCLNFGNAEISLTEINGGFEPYNIFVDDFDYGERMNIEYLSIGEHLVTIKDSLGCIYDTLVVISDDGILSVELPSDTTLCFGDSLFILPIINLSSDSISSIVWSSNIPCDGCNEVKIFLDQNMDISIQITDIDGCIVEESFSIKVDRPNNLPFPQIFSPNGDNINDVFYMPMTKGLDNINYIKIYDNWGGLLYNEVNLTPGDDSKGWRGTVNGQNAEIGVYVVEALVTLVNGTQVVYVDDLTLIR